MKRGIVRGLKFHRLSKRDARSLSQRLAALGEVGAAESAAVLEEGDVRLYWVGGLTVAEQGGLLFPVLDEASNARLLSAMPSLVVDMGAVARIADGADVMGPGVVSVRGEFSAGGLVVARDERHGRAVAICRALVDSGSLAPRGRGKVAETIHHPGDKVWRLAERLRELLT
ncbi:MAG: PUA domain-containing protein [Nitrososphaerota archaeon]